MPPTVPAASTKIRWGRTIEQIRQNWNDIFQSEICAFKDEWVAYYEDELPKREEWDEPVIKPLKITYKCKECANIWINHNGRVHLFFRLLAITKETRKKGEVLICLEYQHCPKCTTSTAIPEMDVERSEMSAVMSNLKDEIGCLYYKIHYIRSVGKKLPVSKGKAAVPLCYHDHYSIETLESTTKEERRIKNSKKFTKKTMPNAAVSVPSKSAVVSDKQFQHKKQQRDNFESKIEPASASSSVQAVSNHNDREKLVRQAKPIKKNTTVFKEAVASEPSTIPVEETRKNFNKFSYYNHSYYNPSPKQRSSEVDNKPLTGTTKIEPQEEKKPISRYNKKFEDPRKKQWQPLFDNLFQKFITKRDPDDKWTIVFGKVPIKGEGRQDRDFKDRCLIFLDCRVLTNFRCRICANSWDSFKPKVSFQIRQNHRRSFDWSLTGGLVTIDIKTGQKCMRCSAQYKSYYEKGEFHEGEIERILDRVIIEVEIELYGRKLKRPEWKGNKSIKPHVKELCENCQKGDCEETTPKMFYKNLYRN